MLFNLASSAGFNEITSQRDLLLKELTKAEIEEAQALASKWKVGQPLPIKTVSVRR